MPDFDEHPEFRSLLMAARANADDSLPRLALADWLDERGWAVEAAYYRSEVSAAVWRLELALRELLALGLDLPEMAAVCLIAKSVNDVAQKIHEGVAQRRGESRQGDPVPPAPGKRPRKPKRPRG